MIPRKDLRELAIKTAKEQEQERIRKYHQSFNYALKTTIKKIISINQGELFKDLSTRYDGDILRCALKNQDLKYFFGSPNEDMKSVAYKLCEQYGIAKLEYHEDFVDYNVGSTTRKVYVFIDKGIINLVALIRKYFPDRSESELIQACENKCEFYDKFDNAEWIILDIAEEYQRELFKRTVSLFEANGYSVKTGRNSTCRAIQVDCSTGKIDVKVATDDE